MTTNSLTLNLSGQVRPPESVVDQDVAWHYGDPLREQKNLIQGLGAVDISNRGVIKISGNDRKTFLHSLTSQHIERLKTKESCSTLLLTPNGHIEHELHVINNENEIYLIVEKSSLTLVLEFFKKMVFMSQVELTDQTSSLAAIFEPIREKHKDFPTWLTPINYAGEPISDAGQSAGGDPNRYAPTRPGIYKGREILINRNELEGYLQKKRNVSWNLGAGSNSHSRRSCQSSC